MDPFVAHVDETLCGGCQTCLAACPFSAVTRDETTRTARVNEALCAGCGTCAASCPCDAIQQDGFRDAQIHAEVLALLESQVPETVTA